MVQSSSRLSVLVHSMENGVVAMSADDEYPTIVGMMLMLCAVAAGSSAAGCWASE